MTREDFNKIKSQMLNNGWTDTDSRSKLEAQENSMIADADWGIYLTRSKTGSDYGGEDFWLNVDTAENAPLDIVSVLDFDDDTLAKFKKRFPTLSPDQHGKVKMRRMLAGELIPVFHKRGYVLKTSSQIKSGLQNGSMKESRRRAY